MWLRSWFGCGIYDSHKRLTWKKEPLFFFFQCKRLAHRGMKESPDWPVWIREVLLFPLQHVTLKTGFVVTL